MRDNIQNKTNYPSQSAENFSLEQQSNNFSLSLEFFKQYRAGWESDNFVREKKRTKKSYVKTKKTKYLTIILKNKSLLRIIVILKDKSRWKYYLKY